ncbi:MAG: hypothetical protein JWN81_2894, partial [Solirubrobacterales bacterium]|nr:hypothetical protein [Solirubrobacterales bacterium]
MTVPSPNRRLASSCLALLTLALGLDLAPAGAHAAGSARSPYPAGATRASIIARPSDFARPAVHRSRAGARGRSAASRSPR